MCRRIDPKHYIAAGYAAIVSGVFAARPARDGLDAARLAARPVTREEESHDKRARPRPAGRSSADAAELRAHVVHLARFGMLYRLPVVLSTVNVATGRNQPTIAPLQDVLPGIPALDRTTLNAWATPKGP